MMSVAKAVQTTAKAQDSGASALLVQRKRACGGSAGLSGECEACRTKRLLGQPLQTKLRINEPGDEYEQEADRVAEQVMRMSDDHANAKSSPSLDTPLVQRSVSAGNATGVGTAPSIVQDVLSSPGEPLDAASRAFFEPRFGHDFGHVRVHHDGRAAESARALNALAYTAGNHIVFGTGHRTLGGARGELLLAHELAHVQQQARAGGYAIQRKGDPQSAKAWEFASNYRDVEPSTYENLLAEVSPARARAQMSAVSGAAPEYDLQGLVKLTALDLMNQYRRQMMAKRDAAKLPDHASKLMEETSAAAETILTMNRKRRVLERSRSRLGALRARTNTGGVSPFTETWASQVVDYTREYRNEEIANLITTFADWTARHQSEITEGDRFRGTALLLDLENVREGQIRDITRRINQQYREFPFLAQFWLEDALTETAESLLDDTSGDILSTAKSVSEAAASAINMFDPTGLIARGRKYAEARAESIGRSMFGPSLADFAENSLGVSAVLDAYDQLLEHIDDAIGVIGSEDIHPFELPEAVGVTRVSLPPYLQKELDAAKQRHDLVAFAKTLGLSVLEAGLALLPVVGPAAAFAAGAYASASDAESMLDRRTLGRAADNPEGEVLGVEAPKPGELALSAIDLVSAGVGVVDVLDVPRLDIDAPDLGPARVPVSPPPRVHAETPSGSVTLPRPDPGAELSIGAPEPSVRPAARSQPGQAIAATASSPPDVSGARTTGARVATPASSFERSIPASEQISPLANVNVRSDYETAGGNRFESKSRPPSAPGSAPQPLPAPLIAPPPVRQAELSDAGAHMAAPSSGRGPHGGRANPAAERELSGNGPAEDPVSASAREPGEPEQTGLSAAAPGYGIELRVSRSRPEPIEQLDAPAGPQVPTKWPESIGGGMDLDPLPRDRDVVPHPTAEASRTDLRRAEANEQIVAIGQLQPASPWLKQTVGFDRLPGFPGHYRSR